MSGFLSAGFVCVKKIGGNIFRIFYFNLIKFCNVMRGRNVAEDNESSIKKGLKANMSKET